MLDQATLRSGLERLRARLEEDITERAEEETSIAADLRQRYEAARTAKRTGLSFELWRAGEVTQAAVAWLLACVFVRFLEDNHLIEQPWISGPANRLAEAKEQNLRTYRAGQWQTDRDYLLLCFEEIRKLPGVSALFDKEHNPLFRLTTTGHGARAIIDFFQKADDQGNLVHDFTGTIDNTRFLGDLYQNISESARKRYALVQTPDFVVDFILDRTMGPALQEFGLEGFRIIDPACGSGHFLISAFERLFFKWQKRLPPVDLIDCARQALGSVYGVDLNPFAIAIARFRLLVVALNVCKIQQLREAPNFQTNLAVGDSLLHGTRPGTSGDVQRHAFDETLNFFYEAEDGGKLREYLRHESYHAVVGNPPYISVKDPVLRQEYRARFGSCYRTYQMGIPFTERFFDLARAGARPGYVGIINAFAFAKQHFGHRLVQEFFPKWEITHVVDTSRAHIPDHGTPTVILLGRNRLPVTGTIRVVGGIRAESSAPGDPCKGEVWAAIVEQIDRSGSHSAYVTVSDVSRATLHTHPWSIGGGGLSELKNKLDATGLALETLLRFKIGGGVRIVDEQVFVFPKSLIRRSGIEKTEFREYLIGESIRDWATAVGEFVWYPYAASDQDSSLRYLWPWRISLASRATFQGNMADAGRKWYEYMQHTSWPYETPISITFGNLSTHNHFSLDRGGRVFNSHAPVIKLKSNSELDHVQLLGLLNSSVACFWMRQVCHNKGGGGIGGGLATESWEQFYEYTGGALAKFPLSPTYPTDLAASIQGFAENRAELIPETFVARELPKSLSMSQARIDAQLLLRRMISLQEELDWRVYDLYRLVQTSITLPLNELPEIELGQRAFEIVMARQVAEGELETEWFNRHGSTPITEIPAHWPEPYRELVQKRIDIIATNSDIGMIEQPEYKRRWNLPKWEDLEAEALRNWLLDRLEDARYWPTTPPMLRTVSNLASAATEDPDFIQVAELYIGRPDFKLDALVAELVEKQSIPFLPVLRYKGLGLTKRKQWEETWDLQRREDAGEIVSINVPPKYEKTDFLSDTGWRVRGKLDVPKERWVSYPHLNRISDATLLIGWAGYDYAQQAFALAAYYQFVKDDGWAPSRLIPVLAGILELLPWVRQWHNAPDAATGIQAGDFLEEFLRNEVSNLNLTQDDLRNWTPPEAQKRPRGSRSVKEKRS